MKNRISTILLLAAVAFAGASCTRTDEFVGGVGESFVTLSSTSVSVREDAGTLAVPVRLVHPDGKGCKVTVTVTDGTAVNGKHYTLKEPATGVLDFGPADTLKNIVFGLTHIEGYLDPGHVDFSMSIKVIGDVALGSRHTASVAINDADHPLSDILGAYTATADDYFSGAVSWTMTLMPKAGDLENIIIDGITETFVDGIAEDGSYDYSMTARVTGEEGSRYISIPYGTAMKTKIGGNTASLWGFNGQYVYNEGDLIFKQQPDGSFIVGDEQGGYGIGYRTDSGVTLYDLLKPNTFSMKK